MVLGYAGNVEYVQGAKRPVANWRSGENAKCQVTEVMLKNVINADGSKGCGGVYYMPPQHPVVGVFCLYLCEYKFTTKIRC